MANSLFLQVLNLSFAGSVAIAVVLLLRLLLRKAPKIFSYILWSVVLFRLLCPFSFESQASILPTKPAPIPMDIALQVRPKVETGLPAPSNEAINTSLPTAEVAQAAGASVNPLQIWLGIGEALWCLGMLALLVYSVISLLRLRKRVSTALAIGDGIYHTENIETPFVMGLFFPKIYLPLGLSEQEQGYILLHERTHIRRGDHIVKLIAFATLCLHWFNPLVWLAFFLMGKDMEMSCDEAVIRKLGDAVKRDYSSSLLSLASGRRMLSGTPLAFGEGDTKGRIQHVLHYKRPAFWAIVAALLLVVTACVTLALDPLGTVEIPENSYQPRGLLYESTVSPLGYGLEKAALYHIAADREVYRLLSDGQEWTPLGRWYAYDISKSELKTLFHTSEPPRELAEVHSIYRVDSEAKQDTSVFLLLMPLKNGSLLLSQGYDDGAGERYVQALWKLEPQIDLAKAKELWKYRTPEVGTEESIWGVLDQMSFPQGMKCVSYQLESDETPIQLSIRLQNDETWEKPRGDSNGNSMSLSALQRSFLNRNAEVLLALFGDLDSIHFVVEVEQSMYSAHLSSVSREELPEDYYQQSATLSGFERVLKNISATLPIGIAAEKIGNGEAIFQAIETAIENTRSIDPQADLSYTGESLPLFESSYRRTESGERIEMLDAILWTTVQNFSLSEDTIHLLSEETKPVLLRFDISDHYPLNDYQEGDRIENSVSAQTWNSMQENKDSEVFFFSQQAYTKVLESGKVNADAVIAKLLARYEQGDERAWEELRFCNTFSLRYAFRAFAEGGQSTSRADTLEQLCKVLLDEGELSNLNFTSDQHGQAWFDALRVSVEAYVERYAEFLEMTAEERQEQINGSIPNVRLLLDVLPQ